MNLYQSECRRRVASCVVCDARYQVVGEEAECPKCRATTPPAATAPTATPAQAAATTVDTPYSAYVEAQMNDPRSNWSRRRRGDRTHTGRADKPAICARCGHRLDPMAPSPDPTLCNVCYRTVSTRKYDQSTKPEESGNKNGQAAKETTVNAKNELDRLTEQKMQARPGMVKHEAHQAVMRERPDLREALVASANQ